MTDWIVETLTNALNLWNGRLTDLWNLLVTAPNLYRGGALWTVIKDIFGALQAVAYALLVLFFVVGVMKTCGSFAEVKKPEHALKLFIRFVLAKAVVTYGLEVLLAFMRIVQGIITQTVDSSGFVGNTSLMLPDEITVAVNNCGFFESIPLLLVSLIGCLLIWVMSFVLILTVYGRLFKLYIYAAVAPIPLSAFAGEPTQNIGKSFLKSFAGVCLEGAVIIVACIIFTAYATTEPQITDGSSAATIVWNYIGGVLFNMLILVGTVRATDRLVKEMMGM